MGEWVHETWKYEGMRLPVKLHCKRDDGRPERDASERTASHSSLYRSVTGRHHYNCSMCTARDEGGGIGERSVLPGDGTTLMAKR